MGAQPVQPAFDGDQMRFIQPMPSGIKDIFKRFRKVMTIEGTWADRPDEDEMIDEENRRYAPLAMMLRSRFLVDIDCWSEARGQPIKPGAVADLVREALQRKCNAEKSATQLRCRVYGLASALQSFTEEFVGFVPGASVLQNLRTCIRVAAKSDTRMRRAASSRGWNLQRNGTAYIRSS